MATIKFDMNQAFVLLDQHKHWTVKTLNRNCERCGYECTIWGNGWRVTAVSGHSPARAAERALQKLREKSEQKRKFKVVG